MCCCFNTLYVCSVNACRPIFSKAPFDQLEDGQYKITLDFLGREIQTTASVTNGVFEINMELNKGYVYIMQIEGFEYQNGGFTYNCFSFTTI